MRQTPDYVLDWPCADDLDLQARAAPQHQWAAPAGRPTRGHSGPWALPAPPRGAWGGLRRGPSRSGESPGRDRRLASGRPKHHLSYIQ